MAGDKRPTCEQGIEREHFTLSLPCVGLSVHLGAYAFQSQHTTTVTISAAISLIYENSLAVLTTAKPLPPIIPIPFYSMVYGTVPCCDQPQTTCYNML